MATRTVAFRLPLPGAPRVTLETDYGFRGGRLLLGSQPLLALASRDALRAGAETKVEGRPLLVRLLEEDGEEEVELRFDGQPVPREDWVRAKPTRSAWVHATLALLASFFGFVAGYLYLVKARTFADAWALKMAIHMAGWHLLLTLSLFPASVWGQRLGIRIVQGMSLLFFLIHAGIALANTDSQSTAIDGPWIAALNFLAGVCFLATVLYGQVAHRDMDPFRAAGGGAEQGSAKA